MARTWWSSKAPFRKRYASHGRCNVNRSQPTVQVLEGRALPSFVAPALFTVGTSPVALAVGDVNGDGIPDVVTADSGSNTVSVLLGNGDGTFQARHATGVRTRPDAVALADLNGDGVLDLVVADDGAASDHRDSDVQVLLGNGDGTFGVATSYGAGIVNPRAVTVADLNGDGIPDLAVADGGSFPDNTDAAVWVLLGNGDGSFQPGRRSPAGAGVTAVAVGDFNGDGIPDLAVANAGAEVTHTATSLSVLLGNGDGTYRMAADFSLGTYVSAVAVADLNGDGVADVVATTYGFGDTPGVHVLLGNGDGTFAAPVRYVLPYGPQSVAVGDLNGDGIPDLVVAGTQNVIAGSGGVNVLLGVGDGTFAAPVAYDVGISPTTVAVADLNGDGALDFVTNDLTNVSDISVVLGNGDGTFRVGVSYPVASGVGAVAVADLNGDGIPDLVTTSSGGGHGTVSVLLGNGDGTFQPATFYGINDPPAALVVADLNGDGIPDLVTTSLLGEDVSVLLGNGDGSFRPAVSYPAGTAPTKVVTGDFNGDGIPDLAVGSSTFRGQTVTLLLGNGDGSFRTQPTFFVAGALGLTAGDFNGDGKADLIGLNTATNTLNVLFGNGDGTFRPAIVTPLPGIPSTLAVGDFNGDGVPDVAVTTFTFPDGPSLSILLGNGDGTFREVGVSLPVNPSAMAVADVNGDGTSDLVTNSPNGTGPLVVWLGNGDGTFRPPQSYFSGFSVTALAVADLNGDGFPEVVTTNGSGGGVVVLINAADWGDTRPVVPSVSRSALHRPVLPELFWTRPTGPDAPAAPPAAVPSRDRAADTMRPAPPEKSADRPLPPGTTAHPRPFHKAPGSVFEEREGFLGADFDG